MMTLRNFSIRHIGISVSFCIVFLVLLNSHSSIIMNGTTTTEENLLDGCYHVYLDVGSNIGMQVRKLFEPEKYPDAKVHSIFNKNFGPIEDRRKAYKETGRVVCAVGFEPNYRHSQYLKELERRYDSCGWRATFMTQSAVSDHNGTTKFYTDEAY